MNLKHRLLLSLVGSWDGIKTNFLLPLLGRTGTALAAWLVTLGADADLAHQLAVGVTAFGLICFDLAVSYLNRKQVVQKGAR